MGSVRTTLPLVALLALATGCSFLLESGAGSGGDGADADGSPIDAPGDVGTWSPWNADATPGTAVASVITTCVIDTDEVATNCEAGAPLVFGDVALWSLESLAIADGALVRVTGSRPLRIVAKTISVTGYIDASSDIGGSGGPGSSMVADRCGAAEGDNGNAGTGGGGGAVAGGAGGDGRDAAMALQNGGLGGGRVLIEGLVAGCPGANLGGGAPAPGGGAIHLIATETIEVSGQIDAGGAGGAGGLVRQAGSGGGAGGMVVLDSPSVTVIRGSGRNLFARGGGGGGGASVNAGFGGGDGTIGGSGNSGVPGLGEAGAGAGGKGGDGVLPALTPDNGADADGTANVGGGGGGGAFGYILINTTSELPDMEASSPPYMIAP